MCFLIYGELMSQTRYPDNCHPPPLPGKWHPSQGWGLGQVQGWGLGLGATRQVPPRKITPQLGLGVWFKVSFGVERGVESPSETIVNLTGTVQNKFY